MFYKNVDKLRTIVYNNYMELNERGIIKMNKNTENQVAVHTHTHTYIYNLLVKIKRMNM